MNKFAESLSLKTSSPQEVFNVILEIEGEPFRQISESDPNAMQSTAYWDVVKKWEKYYNSERYKEDKEDNFDVAPSFVFYGTGG